MSITLNGTTGIIADSPATVKANAYLDAAGGNTATINGKLPIAIGDVPASMTLLGTLATTSGTSVTLSGLTLTPYKQLQYMLLGVSGTVLSTLLRLNGYTISTPCSSNLTDVLYGGGTIDLGTGVFWGSSNSLNAALADGNQYVGSGRSGLTTASTSITFTISGGAFDAGSIQIFGVK